MRRWSIFLHLCGKIKMTQNKDLLSIDQWGPNMWKSLHAISFAFPENPSIEQRLAAERVFRDLQHMIPCPKCQEHYRQQLEKYPLRCENRTELTKWLVAVHNRVNEQNHKKTMSYEDVCKMYAAPPRRKSSARRYTGTVIISVLLVAVAVGIIVVSRKVTR